MTTWRMVVLGFLALCASPAFGQGPRELEIMERRVGTWDTQTTIKPGVWVRDGLKTKGVETVQWALGKKVLHGVHKHDNGLDAMFVETYDPDARVFRSWYFDSKGVFPRHEVTGKLGEQKDTLVFTGTDANQVTATLVLRLVGRDAIEWTGIWREKGGRIVLEIEGKLTRRKKNR